MNNTKYTDKDGLNDRLEMMTSDEAMKLPPVSATDKPVTLHCGGRKEHWKSRFVAKRFYGLGAMACDGSEGDRYTTLYMELLDKTIAVPSDGEPLRKAVRSAA